MFGPVTIDACEILVSDAAQAPAELACHADRVELGALSHDGLDGVDMVRNQLGRHPGKVGGVLDDPAKAFGGGAGRGEAESGGASLDVVGGAEEFVARGVGEAVREEGGGGRGGAGRE